MTGPRPYRVRAGGRRLAAPTTTTRGPSAYAGMDDGKREATGTVEEIRTHWAEYWRLMDAGKVAQAMGYRARHRDAMG